MILYGSSDPGALLFIKENIISKSKNKFKKIKNVLLLKKNIINTKVLAVLTGSAIGNTIDKKLVSWAKKNDILSISVIEHWTNLDKRFILNNKKCYPDYIFVNDIISKKQAIKQGIPKKLIIVFGNNYLHYLQKKNLKLDNKPFLNRKTKKVLFISEPLTEDGISIRSKVKKDEFTYLNILLENSPIDWEIHIKLHPRENQSKYVNYKKIKKIIKKKNLIKLINDYELIIGINSMLLVEIGLFRNNVFSMNFNSKKIFLPTKFKILDQINSTKRLKNIFNRKLIIEKNNKFKKNFKQKVNFDHLLKKLLYNDRKNISNRKI